MSRFSGVYAAAITPRRDDEIDLGAMLELIDYLGASKVDGIVLLGPAGEFPHFTVEDRVRLLKLAVRRSRVPVIAGVSHSNLDGTIRIADGAMRAGPEALLVMPPYFFPYREDLVLRFYSQFAEDLGANLPVLLHECPAVTSPMPPAIAAALLDTGDFTGLLQDSENASYLTEVRAFHAGPFDVLTGNEQLWARGCSQVDAVVSPVACAIPELILALQSSARNGRQEVHALLSGRLDEFLTSAAAVPFPYAIREAVAARGLAAGPHAIQPGEDLQREVAQFREWFQHWLPTVKQETNRAF